MALLTDSWLLDCFGVLTALIAVSTAWLNWCHGYWHRRGLVSPPTSLLFGNAQKSFAQTESFGDFIQTVYDYIRKQDVPHGGFYVLHMPSYIPLDPEIIKHIMQNDFDHFVARGVYYNEEADPLSAHLFSIEGTKWRNLRTKLTPTFTSGKMKMMFDTLVQCSDQLKVEMDKLSAKNESLDIKDVLARFTIDIIGNCAFGIDCNSLKNPDNDFNKYMKLFFTDSFWANIVGFFTFILPGLARKLKVKVTNPVLEKFFMGVVTDTVAYREKNNVYRKDFMHLLLQLKNRGQLVDDENIFNKDEDNKDKKVSLTMDELAAQAFVFFLAGFETSSTTMTFCLYELASNPDIQEKLREEVIEVLERHGNKLTYDGIMDMHYMEQVINETLRKYPPLPVLNRVCNKKYKVPGYDLVLEKGTNVAIPVLPMQRDPRFYPEPEKFEPERFSQENKKKRHPYTFIPFGEGPRICIGLRFGMMQTKVGLATVLQKYRFSVSSKTKVPIELDPVSFIMTTKGGMWLDVEKV